MESEETGRRPHPSFLKPLGTWIADPAMTVIWASNLPHLHHPNGCFCSLPVTITQQPN